MTNWTPLMPSRIGPLRITVDDLGRLLEISFHGRETGIEASRSTDRCAHVIGQLEQYCAHERRDFELELAAEGTQFQLEVWAGLTEIPYGTTISYGELADRIGRHNAFRAVGQANGRNPISLVVP